MHERIAKTFVGAILAVGLTLAPPASAHHKPGHERGNDKDSGDRPGGFSDDRGVKRHGPPPWAPAHGYRAKHRYKSRDGRIRTLSAAELIRLPDGGVGSCNRQALGAALGAAVGAVVVDKVDFGDGKILAKVGGAIAGALIGGSLGRAMDQVDQNCIGQALERAPDRTPVGWRDGSGQNRYEVTPTGTYKDNGGRYCRTYRTTVVIGGQTERAEGTACRQSDGSWRKT